MAIDHIVCKLGNMRKEVEWVVYPLPKDEPDSKLVSIQSDHRYCVFDKETGKGLLSKHCGSGAYSIHAHPSLGATPITVPKDIIEKALAARPKSGDQIGPGIYIA